MSNLVSTKEVDYLDEDKPIRNQNFCLLSFITPQDVLKNKESYYIKYFLKKFSNDIESLFNGLLSFSKLGKVNFPSKNTSASSFHNLNSLKKLP